MFPLLVREYFSIGLVHLFPNYDIIDGFKLFLTLPSHFYILNAVEQHKEERPKL